jgi:hypothetical protein
MTNKTKELVAAGYALAKDLHCAESAALVRELATQLDVQLSRSNALAAENAGLKAAHPQPFGPVMMKALMRMRSTRMKRLKQECSMHSLSCETASALIRQPPTLSWLKCGPVR